MSLLTTIMGIINVTPDSFYSDSCTGTVEAAFKKAEQMIAAGANILDIGGESTRPFAEPISCQQELDRVIPVIEAIHNNHDIKISVDTSTPQVMQAAVAAGATVINDIRALTKPGALEMASQLMTSIKGGWVCLMHMQGAPKTMQRQPTYHNVVEEVFQYLQRRITICESAGLSRSQLVIDPGFGFGKTCEHNLALLRRLNYFTSLSCPVMIGVSRKSLIGKISNVDVQGRLPGSLALAVLGVEKGARILRVHDVEATIRAIEMAEAVFVEG